MWHVNTPALPARSPTARSACLPPTCRATAMPSSTGRCIYRGVDHRCRPAGGGPGAARGSLCHQSAAGHRHGAMAAQVAFRWVMRHGFLGMRGRDGAAAGEQGLCARRQSHRYLLGLLSSFAVLISGMPAIEGIWSDDWVAARLAPRFGRAEPRRRICVACLALSRVLSGIAPASIISSPDRQGGRLCGFQDGQDGYRAAEKL